MEEEEKRTTGQWMGNMGELGRWGGKDNDEKKDGGGLLLVVVVVEHKQKRVLGY
jgi:hypothetical protein